MPQPKVTMQEFQEFMARIGIEWEQPELTTRGYCFEVPAMVVYFGECGDNDEDATYINTIVHLNGEDL